MQTPWTPHSKLHNSNLSQMGVFQNELYSEHLDKLKPRHMIVQLVHALTMSGYKLI